MSGSKVGTMVRRAALGVVLAVVTAIVVIAATATSDIAGYVAIPIVVVAIAAVIALVSVPVHWLPTISLIVFVALPLQLVPSDGVFNVLRPTTIIIGVWVARRLLARRAEASGSPHPAVSRFGGRFGVYALAGLLLLWLLYTFFWSVERETSATWIASFAAAVFLPMFVFDARAEARLLRSTFIWAGGIVGVYAVVEQLLGLSPVYDTIYAITGASVSSPWSVYRSEAGFGHPLFAGAFLLIPAALGVSDWLGGGRTRSLVLAGLSAIGVVMTVSRGSILAVGIACFIALVLSAVVHRERGLGRPLLLGGFGLVALVGLLGFQPLTARSESVESSLSAGARDVAQYVALKAAEASSWIGSGPGTSGISGRQFVDVVIENSMLQLLISIGIPGLLIFLLFFAALATESLRLRNAGAAAAVIGYLIAIAGFNSIDAVRSMHVVLGYLVILCLNDVQTAKSDSPTFDPWRAASALDRPRSHSAVAPRAEALTGTPG